MMMNWKNLGDGVLQYTSAENIILRWSGMRSKGMNMYVLYNGDTKTLFAAKSLTDAVANANSLI